MSLPETNEDLDEAAQMLYKMTPGLDPMIPPISNLHMMMSQDLSKFAQPHEEVKGELKLPPLKPEKLDRTLTRERQRLKNTNKNAKPSLAMVFVSPAVQEAREQMKNALAYAANVNRLLEANLEAVSQVKSEFFCLFFHVTMLVFM